MSKSFPISRQISWIAIVIHLLLIVLFFIISTIIFPGKINYSFIFFILISLLLKFSIASYHRKGIKLFKKGKYLEAIENFEKSYLFFKKNSWLDDYRFITLLSSSKISYKEIALNNMAFCYAQLGNGQKAKEFYEKTLTEFPNSGIAKAGINILNAGQNTIN